MAKRYLKWASIALCIAPVAWVLFWFFCRPVIALHYSAKASEEIGYFLNDNSITTKRGLMPGETTKYPTAMFPDQNMWILLTFPFDSKASLEITKPFSRIDVYIGPGGQIERTVVRHSFFARFFQR